MFTGGLFRSLGAVMVSGGHFRSLVTGMMVSGGHFRSLVTDMVSGGLF
jgi:hypothetical protein